MVLAVGCGQADVRSYQVPKETVVDVEPAQPPRLTWKTPAGWQEKPGSAMRVASFQVIGPEGQQADVSVIPLAGGAGSDLDNVNRWRGQVGLAPVTESELSKIAQAVEVAGQPAMLFEQTSAEAAAPVTILAVIQRRQGTAWFYKMSGNTPLVAAQKETFLKFLREVRY